MVEGYTMPTMNADAHPLMSRMHKPDQKLGPHERARGRSSQSIRGTGTRGSGGLHEGVRALIRLTALGSPEP